MPAIGSDGLVDFHNHLIPGVDDGASDLNAALAGIRRMRRAGIRHLVCTPHIAASLSTDREMFLRRFDALDEAWTELSEAVAGEFPEMKLARGHEVLLDVPEPDLSDSRLRLGGTSFVLVEWPRLRVPENTPDVLSRIRSSGIHPVVAHPERYVGIESDISLVRQWKEVGAYLQVNHGSFAGRYGEGAQEVAVQLLSEGLVDYLSSDFHGQADMPLYIKESREALVGLGAGEHYDLLTRVNPEKLLRDEEPLPAGALYGSGRSLWSRLADMLGGRPLAAGSRGARV